LFLLFKHPVKNKIQILQEIVDIEDRGKFILRKVLGNIGIFLEQLLKSAPFCKGLPKRPP
jgi:hypothetical protein